MILVPTIGDCILNLDYIVILVFGVSAKESFVISKSKLKVITSVPLGNQHTRIKQVVINPANVGVWGKSHVNRKATDRIYVTKVDIGILPRDSDNIVKGVCYVTI